MSEAIEIRNLKKTYHPSAHKGILNRFFGAGQGEKTISVLNRLELIIPQGEITALLGANGVGKTTLLKILCGLILPDSGSVRVHGVDVIRQPERTKALLGLVTAQDGGFYRRLTGRQNLEFFGSLYGYSNRECRRRIRGLSALLQIFYLDEWYQEYSTGMKHWLALARVLMHEPSVLLMDEPTRSLDPEAASRLRRLIKARFAQTRPLTILFTTHQAEEAVDVADRIAVLRSGRIDTVRSPYEFSSEIGNREMPVGAVSGETLETTA